LCFTQWLAVHETVCSTLVSVNPYENLHMYTPEAMRLYNTKELYDLPPHIYGTAQARSTPPFRSIFTFPLPPPVAQGQEMAERDCVPCGLAAPRKPTAREG
jgi:hypothetical protein